MADDGLEGLYLEQNGQEYHFLRLYADGELLFASMEYSWPRQKTIADVSRWFARGSKKLHVTPYRYRYENGTIAFEYSIDGKRFEVHGEVDAIGRVGLVWRDLTLGNEWRRVYSRLSEGGATLPVYVNAAGAETLAELPGINQALATRIVEYRGQHGDFKDPVELLRVKGITNEKLDAVRKLCDFAPAPVLRASPVSRTNVTRELFAKLQLDPDEPPPSPAESAALLRRLGRFDVYWEVRHPGREQITILCHARGEDAFELRGYHVDDTLLEPLLEVVDRYAPQEIRRLPGVLVLPFASERFDRVIVVPGHVKSYFPPPFGHAVHRIYPLRSFEVPDGMSGEEFGLLTDSGGKARLNLFEWNRDPQPLLRLRVLEPPPDTEYKKMKQPELTNPKEVGLLFERHFYAGKVEIWDIAGRHVALNGGRDAITAELRDPSEKHRDVEIAHESFGRALDRFLKGGSFA